MNNESPSGSTEPPAAPEPTGQNTSKTDGQEVEVGRALRLLARGKISRGLGRLRWSSNHTSIVMIKDEELEALAVYKPQCGERPLWDFPDGTLCYREVAAFVVAEALGWELVPPTILREEGPDGRGSLQLFIEHDPEINYFSLDERFLPELQQMALFDCLANNADRKGGHCLVDSRGKLWGIDHGICFHPYPKLRTVIWDFAGEPIPDALLADVKCVSERLCDAQSPLHLSLRALLHLREIDALARRAARLLESQTYPLPGPGPSYPWPPV